MTSKRGDKTQRSPSRLRSPNKTASDNPYNLRNRAARALTFDDTGEYSVGEEVEIYRDHHTGIVGKITKIDGEKVWIANKSVVYPSKKNNIRPYQGMS